MRRNIIYNVYVFAVRSSGPSLSHNVILLPGYPARSSASGAVKAGDVLVASSYRGVSCELTNHLYPCSLSERCQPTPSSRRGSNHSCRSSRQRSSSRIRTAESRRGRRLSPQHREGWHTESVWRASCLRLLSDGVNWQRHAQFYTNWHRSVMEVVVKDIRGVPDNTTHDKTQTADEFRVTDELESQPSQLAVASAGPDDLASASAFNSAFFFSLFCVMTAAVLSRAAWLWRSQRGA